MVVDALSFLFVCVAMMECANFTFFFFFGLGEQGHSF